MSRITEIVTSFWSEIRGLCNQILPCTRRHSNEANGNNNNYILNGRFGANEFPLKIEEYRFVLNNNRKEIRTKLGIDHIGKMCGHGGNCEVYQGFNSEKVPYALKVQSSALRTNEEWQKEVMNEVQLLKQFKHENVVKMFDNLLVGNRKPNEYSVIKFEYLNTSLKKYLKVSDKGFLTFEESINLAKQISPVLGWMHANGVAHHDVKPSNIMFNADFSKPIDGQLEDVTYKIIDFGYAFQYNKTGRDSLERHLVGGTKFFVSPEKWSCKSYDPFNSDSYSMAVTLLQAMMGIKRLNYFLKHFRNFDTVADLFVYFIELFNEPYFDIDNIKSIGMRYTQDPNQQASMAVIKSETKPGELDECKKHTIPFADSCENFKELLQYGGTIKNDLEYLKMVRKLLSKDPSKRITMAHFNERIRNFEA